MMATLPRYATPMSVPGMLLLPLLLLLLPIALSQKPLLLSPPDPTPAPLYLSRPECTRREHPVVTFQALSPWISIFSHPGVRDYSQLTLDLTRNELIVGARNFLFRLSLNNVSLIQATEWIPDDDTRRSCQSKGKTEVECQNYLRVLLVNKTEVITCGTNAFQPLCITREHEVKRRRKPEDTKENKRRKQTFKYHVQQAGQRLNVCKVTFMSVFQLTNSRLQLRILGICTPDRATVYLRDGNRG